MYLLKRRSPKCGMMSLFFVFLIVYLYLITNAFNSTRTSTILKLDKFVDKVAGNNNFEFLNHETPMGSLKLEVTPSYQHVTQDSSPRATSTPIHNHLFAAKELGLEKAKQNNYSLPLLTVFTSWNESVDRDVVHNITMSNWASFKPFVIPILFTNTSSLANASAMFGWNVLPVRVTAADLVPVLKYMYLDAMANFNSTFYAFCNGDILFTNSLIDTLMFMRDTFNNDTKPLMIVGRRTNVDNVTEEEGSSWSNIRETSKARGKLFNGWAEDYFITTRAYPWIDMAEVVIGRRAYDNWLVYSSRKAMQTVVDVTETVLAVHQTTVAGNFEGHSHSNGEYNHKLLTKLYRRVKYSAGVVECVELYTIDRNETFQINFRSIPKSCKT